MLEETSTPLILILSRELSLIDEIRGVLAERYTFLINALPSSKNLEKISLILYHPSSQTPSPFQHSPSPPTLSLVKTGEELKEAFRSGSTDALLLPLNPSELVARVEKALKLHQSQKKIREMISNLKELSEIDPLTHVYNKQVFAERVKVELNKVIRNPVPLSLLMLDIDHFKEINDTHGHPAGDHVIASLIETIRHHLRDYDLIGRFGGDEFMIFLPNTAESAAAIVADKIRRVAEEKEIHLGEHRFHYTVSIGMTTIDSFEKGLSSESCYTLLIDQADQALLEAKSLGKNRLICKK